MRPRYVVDTNVLIAASAVNPDSRTFAIATPDEPELRRRVWEWLSEFQRGDSRLVLDGAGRIRDEYDGHLRFDDFGQQVVLHKLSTSQYDLVDVRYGDDGVAELDATLTAIVHDPSDRKLVAAALAAIEAHGDTAIANACDSDWIGWEAGLAAAGIVVEQILREWCEAKYREKTTGD